MRPYKSFLRSILSLLTPFVLLGSACYGQSPTPDPLAEARSEWRSYIEKIKNADSSFRHVNFTSKLENLLPSNSVIFVPNSTRHLHIESLEWERTTKGFSGGIVNGSHIPQNLFITSEQFVYSKDIKMPSYIPDHYLDLCNLWLKHGGFSEISKQPSRETDVTFPFPVEEKKYFNRLSVSTDVNTVGWREMQVEDPFRIGPRGLIDELSGRIPKLKESSHGRLFNLVGPTNSIVVNYNLEAQLPQYKILLSTKHRLEQERPIIEAVLIALTASVEKKMTILASQFQTKQEKAIRIYEVSDSQDFRVLAASAKNAMSDFNVELVARMCNEVHDLAMKHFDGELNSVRNKAIEFEVALDEAAEKLGITRAALIERHSH
jgi:hypothetical protein